MITILHGEEIVKSRKHLEGLKRRDKEVVVLDGGRTNLTEIIQALESQSLFGKTRLVVIENLLTGKKKKDEILVYLQKLPPEVELILWEGKELEKSRLGLFPQAKVMRFRPEPVLFKFLESLRPGNIKVIITLLRQTLMVEEPEMVFYMLVRQFRLLLAVKEGKVRGIEELNRLNLWQLERLQNQAKYFTMEKLVEIYQKLLKIDFEQKTGQAAFDLAKNLELFLLSLGR